MNCNSLKSIDLKKVSVLGDYAFVEAVGLESIVVPGSVKYVGDSAFSKCTSLKSVVIERNVRTTTKLLDDVFFHCSALTTITIPKSVVLCKEKRGWLATDAKDSIFYGCTSLKEIHGNRGHLESILPEPFHQLIVEK